MLVQQSDDAQARFQRPMPSSSLAGSFECRPLKSVTPFSRSGDARFWHLASNITAQKHVRSWVQTGSDRHPAKVSRLTRFGHRVRTHSLYHFAVPRLGLPVGGQVLKPSPWQRIDQKITRLRLLRVSESPQQYRYRLPV